MEAARPRERGRRRRRGSRPRYSGSAPARRRVSGSDHAHRSSSAAAVAPPPPPCTDFDMAYFKAYAHVGVHEDMIKDRVRTETYRNAIMQHQSYIDGKVVVDVGCGTGILSIFCAQAGAKRVYAVDASDIAVQAKEVVKANNLSGTVIVLHGRVEDVQIHEKVDVIVSEWMGYMLLYESMLGSVITARDRWLKAGGLLLPSTATLYMAPVTHPDRYNESIDFWRNVYGINMSAMLPLAKQCAFEEPCVETITGENVLTWPHVVKHVDCYTITAPELESVTTRFKFQSMLRAPLHGFAFWFDVEFGVPAIPSASNQAPLPILPISYVPSHDHSISPPVVDGPSNGHPIPLPVADEPANDHSVPVPVPDADESSNDHLLPLLPAADDSLSDHLIPLLPAADESSSDHSIPPPPDVDEPSSDHSIAPLPVADETSSDEPSNDHSTQLPDADEPLNDHSIPLPVADDPTKHHSVPVPVANEPSSNHSTPLPDAGEPSNDHSTPLPDADEPSNDHSTPLPDADEPSNNHSLSPPDADEPLGVDSIDGSQRKKRANPNKALILSTSPEDPSTHWQQTLIYFYEPIELEQGQVIEGSATLTQNRQHARFMNIRIDYTSGGRSFVKYAVMH